METVKSETKAKDNDTVLKPENDSLTWEEAVYKGAEILTDFKELKDDDTISKDGNEHPEVSSAFCFYYYAVALCLIITDLYSLYINRSTPSTQ